MQRNPEELYELGPAAPDIADAPMLHYLEGFIDAGNAGRLLAEHLLSSLPHETVARFDVGPAHRLPVPAPADDLRQQPLGEL